MKMVLLAAGHGRRFGGLKQLAPVGPGGEALIDYTVRHAERAGFSGVVLVVRAEIRDEILEHARRHWPDDLSVETVVQGELSGTVPAVLAAVEQLDAPFAVANADDLYGEAAFRAIATHFAQPGREHVLVGYRLRNTVLTTQPVKRGLCLVHRRAELTDLVEHHVCARPDGGFDAVALEGAARARDAARVLLGEEPVSMNLWGFRPGILDHLAEAAERHRRRAGTSELLLPEVVGSLVRSGRVRVRVAQSEDRCIGLTHREDIPLVQRALVEVEPEEAVLGIGSLVLAPSAARAHGETDAL